LQSPAAQKPQGAEFARIGLIPPIPAQAIGENGPAIRAVP
jgi:hypothetical protein